MGGACRPDRGGILSSVVGRGGCDPALLHHDRHRSHRRVGRSPDTYLPHAHGSGIWRAAARTRSDRPPQLPNVVCGNARARRWLSAGLPWMSKGGDTPLAAKIALWGGREIVGLLLVSLLAGTATIPYVSYHFHRISPYGVIANLMAMPVVSAWVMPAGILGLISMPLGFDGLCWRLMGQGIDWMISVALWVTSFPGALGRMAAFGTALAVHRCVADRRRHCADDSRTPARCADRRRRQRHRHPW